MLDFFVFVSVMLTTRGSSGFNGCNKMTVKLRGESFPLQIAKPISHSQKLSPRYKLQTKIALQLKCMCPNNLKLSFLTSEENVLKYLHLIRTSTA